MFQTTATATSEATYGKKNVVRKKFRPRSGWLRSIASPSAASMVSGTLPKTKTSVLVKEIRNV